MHLECCKEVTRLKALLLAHENGTFLPDYGKLKAEIAAKDETIRRLRAELKDDCTWCEDRFTRYDKHVTDLESRLKTAEAERSKETEK